MSMETKCVDCGFALTEIGDPGNEEYICRTCGGRVSMPLVATMLTADFEEQVKTEGETVMLDSFADGSIEFSIENNLDVVSMHDKWPYHKLAEVRNMINEYLAGIDEIKHDG